MTKNIKIVALWLLTICGFACHSITDILPMFWGKDLRIATDGNVPQEMIVVMMTISFFIPACGILAVVFGRGKALKVVNAVLACLIAFFSIAHACMELPTDNAGQYAILPIMIVIGILQAWLSIKYVREN